MIYLIGGTPRAGKSTLSKIITERKGIPYISLDFIVHMINGVQPELNLIDPYAEIPTKFYPYLKNLLINIEHSVSYYTVEGDAFTPQQVSELSTQFKVRSCFMGFSHITLEQIKKNIGENDWLNDRSEQEQAETPAWIIKRSAEIKKECAKCGIQYFDMAEGDYQENLEKAYNYLLE